MSARVIMNTRPREQAAELSRLLEAAGFQVVEAPAIATLSAWDAADLERVRRELNAGHYAWIVLQSVNAAGGLERELSSARLVCGAATAAHLNVRPSVALQHFSARAALDALRPHLVAADRVLVPRAADGRDELMAGLAALGVDVDAPVAYCTVAVE